MLRRRNKAPMSDLTTPLLAQDDNEVTENTDQPTETPLLQQTTTFSSSLPPPSSPPPYSPPSWWRTLLYKLTYLYDELLDFFYWHIYNPVSGRLSLLQASKLEQIQNRAAVVYDADLSEHQQHLQRLWKAAFPGIYFPPGVKSSQWKVMGWQGEDPASDFRGGGYLSLELLVYFAETRPAEFDALMKKTRGSRSDWEYPFAAAGVNITFMLIEILELKKTNGESSENGENREIKNSSRAVIGFLKLLENDENALESLFIESFILLDRVWLEKKASYMDFPQVLREVKKKVSTVLQRRWLKSIDDLKSIHY